MSLSPYTGAEHNGQVEFFPGTREPVPSLLTPEEAARLLRLDIVAKPNGQVEQRAMADAIKSLDHLIRRGVLTTRRFGRSRTFCRDELLNLILTGNGQAE